MQAESTETAEKIVSEVLVRVDALAAKLGTTAEALWPAMVEYQSQEALGKLVVTCAAMVLAWIGFTVSYRSLKTWDEPNIPNLGTIVFGFAAIGLSIASVAVAGHVWAQLACPEAAAINSILGR